MRRAIGYIRVSTDTQGATGIGLDGQRAQIEAFAKAQGYKIAKFYREARSATGGITREARPAFFEAMERSKELRAPIIVANLGRVARNVPALEKLIKEGKLNMMSADVGPDASYAVIMARAARDEAEGRLISERTSRRLQELKAVEGVKLGNPTNLPEAQKLGAEANKAIAEQRLKEFKAGLEIARRAGARTAAQIADELNRMRHPTARGVPWSRGNVERMLRCLKGPGASKATSRSVKPRRPFYTSDGYLTSDGIERLERFMKTKKFTVGDVMQAIGGKRLDASLGGAMKGTRMQVEKLQKIERLVGGFDV